MAEGMDGLAFVFLVAALGAVATYSWRALGVLLGARVDPQSRLFDWLGCVAYALLAGLIARMIVLPIGPLADLPLSDRLIATVGGIAAYFLSGRNIIIGVGMGAAAIGGLSMMR